jgi:hypothetical protein
LQLDAFCWKKSLICKDAFYQGFRYSEVLQKILHNLQVRKIVSLSAVRMTCHPVWTPSCPDDVSNRLDSHQTKASFVRTTWIPVLTFLCVKKLRTAPACIRPDVLAAHPDDSQCSTKLQIFFPKSDMGRLLQPSGRCEFSS